MDTEKQGFKNEYFDTLYLSFKYYKTLIKTGIKNIEKSTDDQEVIYANRRLGLAINQLIVKKFFVNHGYLANYYRVAVDLDWSQFFDYFDLLDAQIAPKYCSNDWTKNQELLSAYSKEVEQNYSLQHYAACKFPKLINKILYELYRSQYSINPYANINPDSLQEKEPINGQVIYKFALKDREQSEINEYINYEDEMHRLETNANLYLASISTLIKSLIDNYGHSIYNNLSNLLYKSYYNRLGVIDEFYELAEQQGEQDLFGDISFEQFFLFTEFLTFRWSFPNVLSKVPRLDESSIVDSDTSLAIEQFGPEVEQDYRNLYAQLLLLENSLIECLVLHMYSKSGRVFNIRNISFDSVCELTKANI